MLTATDAYLYNYNSEHPYIVFKRFSKLYNSPHYPVFNISLNSDCLNSSISIDGIYQLGKVLKYFGYPEKLRYEDIVKIKQFFFNNQFIYDNSSLFGRKETTGIQEGAYEGRDSHGVYRCYNEIIEDSVFPECYFDIFWNTITDFTPKEQEELVRKLI